MDLDKQDQREITQFCLLMNNNHKKKKNECRNGFKSLHMI